MVTAMWNVKPIDGITGELMDSLGVKVFDRMTKVSSLWWFCYV